MIVVKAGQLIDGNGGAPQKDAAVFIEGNRFQKVLPLAEAQIPPDVEVVDALDKTVMPGLIDCHVHIHSPGGFDEFYFDSVINKLQGYNALRAYRHAVQALRMGFTALRSVSSPAYVDVALRDAINNGVVTGPRLYVAGQGLSITSGHMDDLFINPDVAIHGRTGVGDGPWALRAAAREQFKRGADLIKINVSGCIATRTKLIFQQEMTYEEMAAICAEAAERGKRVAGHALGGPGITDAINAGMNSVEHGTWLTDEQIELMIKKNVFYVPTLWVNENGIAAGREKMKQTEERWNWYKNELGETKWETLARAIKAGVKIVSGTDAGYQVFHGDNAEEIIQLHRGGLTTMQALMAATKTAAECLGAEDEIGTVEAGKLADLVIVDGDPLQNLKLLRDPQRITRVYKDGKNVTGLLP